MFDSLLYPMFEPGVHSFCSNLMFDQLHAMLVESLILDESNPVRGLRVLHYTMPCLDVTMGNFTWERSNHTHVISCHTSRGEYVIGPFSHMF